MIGPRIAPETLHDLLRYESDTGKLFWLIRPVELFDDGNRMAQHGCRSWNARFAGEEALSCADSQGYLHGRIFYRIYKAHRVIFAMQTGYWPDEVDHIDHNPSNNLWTNLRAATHTTNCRNVSLSKLNTSGFCGVYWHKKRHKWTATIGLNGKIKYLGSFLDRADAIAARQMANIEYGFHENHGR